MSEFLTYKSNVLTCFNECIHFAKENGFDSVLPDMEAAARRVEENKLYILTCGEMRRGKSSMLAAFLEDEDLFPTDVAVTTCSITMVGYGPKERVTVVLEDNKGKLKNLPISRYEIRDYVMEQNNKNNHKKVRSILVETPNEKLKNGFVFIDTPGVGSLNPEHSLVTYSVLPKADIVLFVSDALSPLTGTELAFLKQVRKHCTNFLFILTKKDKNAEYQQIIEENKEKIAQTTDIPAGKINYVPISNSMKLAYMKRQSPRLLKSSNFEMLEQAIWDTIYKNRADILIMPSLAALARSLKTIEKDINIRQTGVLGSSKELKEMEEKLNGLMEERQSLLSNGSIWQTDISNQLRDITYDFNRMVVDYQTRAQDALEAGLKVKANLKAPEKLLNEIICMTVDTSHNINDTVNEKLTDLNVKFLEKSGISLYQDMIEPPIGVKKETQIAFEKKKMIDKIIDGGRQVSMSTMGGTTAGAVIGGILGGAIGLLGGPGGVIAGAKVGAMLGSSVGMLGGGVRGVTKAVSENHENPGIIQREINKYISQTMNEWRTNFPPYLDQVTRKFIESLKQTVVQSQQEIEQDMKALRLAASMTKENQVEEQRKLSLLRAEFNSFVAKLTALNKIRVTDSETRPPLENPSKRPAVREGEFEEESKVVSDNPSVQEEASDAGKGGQADYSFLED